MTIVCPYCNGKQEPSPDDFEPGTIYEHECEKCGKIFGYEIEYHASYTECELPCANGEPHKWEAITGWPEGYFKNRRRCKYCQEETEI